MNKNISIIEYHDNNGVVWVDARFRLARYGNSYGGDANIDI